MSGRHTGWLGPMPPYADLPVWNHNSDNVGVRLVNAAWNALFTQELDDLTYRRLARDFGAAPQTLYYYYPSVTALGGELALRAVETLMRDIDKDVPDALPPDLPGRKALSRQALTHYLEFAARRPRHFLLIYSQRYASKYEFPALAVRRDHVLGVLKTLFGLEAQRELSEAEFHPFLSLLHGSAALVAAGHPPQMAQLFKTFDVLVDSLRAIQATDQTHADTEVRAPSSTIVPVQTAAESMSDSGPVGSTASTRGPFAPEPPALDDS